MNSLIERRKEWKINFPRAGDVQKVLKIFKLEGGSGTSRKCGFMPVPIGL